VTDLPIGHMAAQRAVLHGGEITIDSGEGSVATHARLPVTPVA
jgi:hypothetical protein